MTIDGEPAKLLLPYLQRADELQKHDHLAAYYCRLYAMERGLNIPAKERTNETKLILVSLMSQLEKDKKVVKLSPDDNMYMEGFALRVFAKADKQDRADRADLKTSMTFYAASIFFEVLLQFGELPPDIQEKQKYASWKAVDIRKAVAEGRKPVPGPPATEKDIPDGDDTTWGTEGNTSSSFETQQSTLPSKDSSFNLSRAPSNSIPPPYNQNPYADGYTSTDPSPYPHFSGTPFDNLGGNAVPGPPTIGTYSYSSDPPGFTSSPAPAFSQDWQGGSPQEDPAQYHQQWPSSASIYPSIFPSAPATPQHPPHGASRHSEPPARTSTAPGGPEGYQLNGKYDSNYQPSAEQVVEAHKASRFAVSALAFDDVPTAISHLRKSLELLTSPSSIQ